MSSLLERNRWPVFALLALVSMILSALSSLVGGSTVWFKARKIIGDFFASAGKLVIVQLVLFAMVGLLIVGAFALDASLPAVGLATVYVVVLPGIAATMFTRHDYDIIVSWSDFFAALRKLNYGIGRSAYANRLVLHDLN